MIDTKDLMVGNLVYENTFLNKPCTILDIVGDKKVFLNEGKAYSMLNEIDPISLTDVFWLKNEFVYQKDDDSYTLFDDYYSINAKEVNDGLWQIVIEHCELINDTEICCVGYVHQLQNFLRLCGINIDFKL